MSPPYPSHALDLVPARARPLAIAGDHAYVAIRPQLRRRRKSLPIVRELVLVRYAGGVLPGRAGADAGSSPAPRAPFVNDRRQPRDGRDGDDGDLVNDRIEPMTVVTVMTVKSCFILHPF